MNIEFIENGGLLKGGFNCNHLIRDERGKKYLLREPHNEQPSLLDEIKDEFQSYGEWLDQGNTVRKRSKEEQVSMVLHATRSGLRTVGGSLMADGRMLVPFIDNAQTIDEFLPHATAEETDRLVHELFADLHKAHKRERIVYGDRWSKNILIHRDLQNVAHPVNIDFDLQYEGKGAVDMEVGRMAFYVLHAGRERAVPSLATALIADGWHNAHAVEKIMRGQAELFEGTQYGGMSTIIEALFSGIHRSIQSGQSNAPETCGKMFDSERRISHSLTHEIYIFRKSVADVFHNCI